VAIQAEEQRIKEEKLALAAEKARLDEKAKNSTAEIERLKAEMQAATKPKEAVTTFVQTDVLSPKVIDAISPVAQN
jgi:predicted nuclease with TOPRIM domain